MFAEGAGEQVRSDAEAGTLRWLVRISVLAAVAAWLPFYVYILDVSYSNLYFSYPASVLLAFTAAEVGLRMFVQRWKRTVYPSFVIKELNETAGVSAAARKSSAIVRELLNVRGAFLFFRPPGAEADEMDLVAAEGIDPDAASLLVGSAEDLSAPQDSEVVTRDGKLVLVPLKSMGVDVGVMGLMNGGISGDTADEELLAGLAYAIGSKLSMNYSEEALRASEQRYRTLIETTPDAILLTSMDGRVVLCNSSAAALHGLPSPNALLDRPSLDFVVIEDRGRFEQDEIDLLQSGRIQSSEYRFTRLSGPPFPGEMRSSLVRDEGGAPIGILRVLRDISERKTAEQTIRSLAYYDSLTGLTTRARFLERLQSDVETARLAGSTLALIFIDLDGFKQINDEFGHAAGDSVLRTVSRRLANVIRNRDTAGRLGGDELVAVLPEVSGQEEASVVARRILESIRQPIATDGRIFNVTASIGVALFPQAASTVKDLISAADSAMYAAKKAGGGRFQIRGEASASSEAVA